MHIRFRKKLSSSGSTDTEYRFEKQNTNGLSRLLFYYRPKSVKGEKGEGGKAARSLGRQIIRMGEDVLRIESNGY